MDDDPLYLGFDLSTQQLKAVVVGADLKTVAHAKVDFDADFGPRYGVTKGVHVRGDGTGEVHAPVLMWLDSLDLVLQRLVDAMTALATPVPMSRIRGISGAGQQHGSVYWNADAAALLAGLDATQPLAAQLAKALACDWSPNWQDHSTQSECDAFDAELGSRQALAQVTGSGAHHRFTGPQIMRLRRLHPDVYARTSRISLVSSWLASVMLGCFAPIDMSDVCGMNLWDVPNQRYSHELLALVAGDPPTLAPSSDFGDGAETLRAKLGEPIADGGQSLGTVSGYFVRRYGFHDACQVLPFTGDNPATILALPLRPLDAIVSLGTSTTLLVNTPAYEPDGAHHFFNHPTTKGQYMFMLCYKNGGLVRERARDTLPKSTDSSGNSWEVFDWSVLNTPPLGIGVAGSGLVDDDNGKTRAKMGLYFHLRETVPNIRAGTWRFTCNPEDGSDLRQEVALNPPISNREDATPLPSAPWSREMDARILVESQALSMRLRSQTLVRTDNDGAAPRAPPQPRRIYLVGGASGNAAIAATLGSVLGGSEGVYKLDVGGNACALGGAYKAAWALERRGGETFDEWLAARWREEGSIEKVDGGYREGIYEQYGKILPAFEEMERRLLEEEDQKAENV